MKTMFKRIKLDLYKKRIVYNYSKIERNYAKVLSDPENIGIRQNHVNFETLGIWNNRIDFRILVQQSIKKGVPIPNILSEQSGYKTLIGRRTKNEDRISINELRNNLLYFAIYDGHGGSLCVDFCHQHLENLISNKIKDENTDLKEVLEKSFIELDAMFGKYLKLNLNHEERNSGTTATVCLLKNSVELYLGHVGDSRAILCRNGKSKKLTVDHTSKLLSEKERINKSGGQVIKDNLGRNLVNGRLAISRSIGDFDLKNFGVTAIPDIRKLEIKHGKDAFLILTTDGINCVMNDQEIVDAVNCCQTTQEAAQFVCEQAMIFASEDNASALILPFGAWGKFSSLSNNMKFSFGRQLNKSTRF